MTDPQNFTDDERRRVVLDRLSIFQIASPWALAGSEYSAAGFILRSADYMAQHPEETPTVQERREVLLSHLRAFQVSDPWIGTAADLAAADAIFSSLDYMRAAQQAHDRALTASQPGSDQSGSDQSGSGRIAPSAE